VATNGGYGGKFIVLDGPDGCGKSTQARLLAGWIEGAGTLVAVFRDPGTTAVGEKIREVLLDPVHTIMDTRTELLLYMAARAQLWAECIKPALDEGKCVVLDRWLSSTCAYQGYAGGFGIENVARIAEDCLERAWPDVTIVLDVDMETAAGRMHRSLDRMERKGRQYHEMVREGFLKLAEQREDFVVVDAGGEVGAVQAKISEVLTQRGWG
jgi:dTMP kinase